MRISRTFIIISVIVILLGVLGYWFFMHTNRGSSLALYAFAGIRAPWDVKIACAHSTDARVDEKFQQPLDFTEEAKNALRGFWYYDYYRECLYSRGYDFSGRPIPSTFFGEGRYTNRFAGFEFAVPASASLIDDNRLDVDYDDHLYTSSLILTDTVTIHAYLKDSTQVFTDRIERVSVLDEPIASQKTVLNSRGVRGIQFTGVNGTRGIAFKTPGEWAVYIFGTEADASAITAISDSLEFVSQ